MAKVFFLLCLLLLISESDSRRLIMVPDHHKPTPASQSHEPSTEKEECKRFDGQCAMGKWMEAQTDYIYTQDVKDP